MEHPKLYEHMLFSIVLFVGAIAGLLLQVAAREINRPWKEIAAASILNGIFTVGVFAAVKYVYPDMPDVLSVSIAAASSTIGRSSILKIAERWAGKK